MRIAAFCAATGLSRDTVRFYEKAGLLRPRVGPTGTNQYREFDASMVERVRGIQRAKAMGFSLREIRELASEYDRDPRDTAAQARWLRDKLVEIDARIRAAREMKAYLLDKLDRLGRASATGTGSQTPVHTPAGAAPRARRVNPTTGRRPVRRAAP